LIDSTFGPGGLSAIQRTAMEQATFRQYEAQQAIKAAGAAAARAATYADLPDSAQFRDAVASRITNENIARSAANDASQIMRNAAVDSALASKLVTVANVLGPAINAAQLGAAASTGDAYVVGQTAVGVLAGMAFGALAVSVATVAGIPLVVTAAIGIAVGFGASKVWTWMWDNGAAEYYGINKGDKFDLDTVWGSIKGVANDFFTAAQNYVIPRRDPLVLDLDGDGLELVAANGTVLFDHNADGIKTGTGWAAPNDGLLVRDLNGNGVIDSGRELFGIDTIKSNNSFATQGFDALKDLDSNADGFITNLDTAFAELKVWQDLNQDGISQAGELKTLTQQGISSTSANGSTSGPQAGEVIAGDRVDLSATFTRRGASRSKQTNCNATVLIADRARIHWANNRFDGKKAGCKRFGLMRRRKHPEANFLVASAIR
jgi:hypothetical protein